MRLVCPRCGAQYEIDASAIPPGGRDVECSACDHVWRATPPDAAAETPAFDPAERPRLSRPLSDSVIEILREEAARELEVRAAEREAARDVDRPATLAVVAEPVPEDEPVAHSPAAVIPPDAPLSAAPPVAIAARPDTAAIQARRRHDAGFHVAVMIAVVALALYALAPRLADDGAFGRQLMEWRTQIDQGRDWLQQRADALLNRGA